MEAPTPVSSLLHAATLVTAGLYLLIRSSPLLEYSPSILLVITIMGALTAIFAATSGLLQNDIKRIIAFSTISQLGYCFMAIGHFKADLKILLNMKKKVLIIFLIHKYNIRTHIIFQRLHVNFIIL
jgi:NADH:ubiquinone oxidoreductase subunit 5 (subunit L)/multisubunit Na+/H+ antiporter MnhA subunit